MTPQIVERLRALYTAYGFPHGPHPSSLTRRLLEEAVELHLAVGGKPSDCYTAVADALANEARKLGLIFPSSLPIAIIATGEITSEVADVTTILAMLTDFEDIAGSDILGEAERKTVALEEAHKHGLLYQRNGAFYRRPPPKLPPGAL